MNKFKVLGNKIMIFIIGFISLAVIMLAIAALIIMTRSGADDQIPAFIAAIVIAVFCIILAFLLGSAYKVFDRLSVDLNGVTYLAGKKQRYTLRWEDLCVSFSGITTSSSRVDNTPALVFYHKDVPPTRRWFFVAEMCMPDGWMCCRLTDKLAEEVKKHTEIACNLDADMYGVSQKSLLAIRKLAGYGVNKTESETE